MKHANTHRCNELLIWSLFREESGEIGGGGAEIYILDNQEHWKQNMSPLVASL